ncbi:hypothetical protein [Clostridium aceticum]|nr:hypothetical protein [Clostridium aceticum]
MALFQIDTGDNEKDLSCFNNTVDDGIGSGTIYFINGNQFIKHMNVKDYD